MPMPIFSHYNSPFLGYNETVEDYGPGTCNLAGYRPLHDRIGQALLSGSLNAYSKALEDYDSDFFPDPEEMDARPFNRMSEFDDIYDYMDAMEEVNDRLQKAHEAVSKAQHAQAQKHLEQAVKQQLELQQKAQLEQQQKEVTEKK